MAPQVAPSTNKSWFARKGSSVMALVGAVPFNIGITLRRIVYRQFLAQLGQASVILPGVELLGPNQIAIGEYVLIDRYVRIRCVHPNGFVMIGNKARIGQFVEMYCYGKNSFEIGAGTHINSYTRLSGSGTIKIGENCLIAPHVGLYSSNHKFSDLTQPIMHQGSTAQGIVIEDDCWLGAGVTVLDGVTIGTGSVIGAGAVVTKNIPPYSVAVGVPAKVVATRQPGEKEASNCMEEREPQFQPTFS